MVANLEHTRHVGVDLFSVSLIYSLIYLVKPCSKVAITSLAKSA
jgi:hypothetical protein